MEQRDPIKEYVRNAKARRRVGSGMCSCGEDRQFALISGRTPPTCYACDRIARGREHFEGHHVFGRRNGGPVIAVPINDHRAELSVAQYRWPRRTLENPCGSPLLAAAGMRRGTREMIAYLRGQDVSDQIMEQLDAWLRAKMGPEWWIGSPLEKYAVPPAKGRRRRDK
jgi:hypothetical protein